MTQREKLLAIAVGSMVGVVGLVYLISSIGTAFSTRATKIVDKRAEITKQQREIMFGKEATRKLEELTEKSLPSELTFARAEYEEWLVDLANNKVKFGGVNANPLMGRAKPDLYYEHPFLLSCEGNLKQLVEFLYEFYQADYLHRVKRVTAQPILGSGRLKIAITVEALSMDAAQSHRKLDNPPLSKLAREDVQEYVEMIAHRNPFAPANKPPSFSRIRPPTGNPNRPLSFTAAASDPEEQSVAYSIAGEAPEGMSINPDTGLVRWTPKENGRYQVKLVATDNGLPARAAETSVAIVVTDAPVQVQAAPKFDPATLAEVTGITESGRQRELWVTVHTEGRVLILHEGDKIAVGTIEGTITEIQEARALIETNEGKEIEVSLGKHLVEATAAGG